MSPEANKITLCDVTTHQLALVLPFFELIWILCVYTNTIIKTGRV